LPKSALRGKRTPKALAYGVRRANSSFLARPAFFRPEGAGHVSFFFANFFARLALYSLKRTDRCVLLDFSLNRMGGIAMKPRLLACLAALTLLVGCKTVYVAAPLGDRPVKLVPDEINGTWSWNGGAAAIRANDPAKGELTLGWIEGGDKEHPFKLNTTTARVREANGLRLLSVATPKPDAKASDAEKTPKAQSATQGPWIFLGAIRVDGHQGWLWNPDWDAIGAQVKAGALPGRLDQDGNVILGKLSPKQADALTTTGMLRWDRPIELKYLGK
jgi:hypothetical protein